jgi:hypothetical protein
MLDKLNPLSLITFPVTPSNNTIFPSMLLVGPTTSPIPEPVGTVLYCKLPVSSIPTTYKPVPPRLRFTPPNVVWVGKGNVVTKEDVVAKDELVDVFANEALSAKEALVDVVAKDELIEISAKDALVDIVANEAVSA